MELLHLISPLLLLPLLPLSQWTYLLYCLVLTENYGIAVTHMTQPWNSICMKTCRNHPGYGVAMFLRPLLVGRGCWDAGVEHSSAISSSRLLATASHTHVSLETEFSGLCPGTTWNKCRFLIRKESDSLCFGFSVLNTLAKCF